MTVPQRRPVLPLLLPVAWGVPLFALLLVALEEFPSGFGEIGSEGVERSTRTVFYAKSVGVPGLYLSDLCLLGLFGLLFMNAVLLKRKRWIAMDGVGLAIVALIAMFALSTFLSFAGGSPFAGSLPQNPQSTLLEFNERALRLIALFQIKNFSMLLPAYLCGLMYLDRPERIDRLILWVFLGCLLLAAQGLVRLGLQPGLLAQGKPLFYDSPSSWFFAMFAFFTLSAWGRGRLPRSQALVMAAISAVLLIFVLISFRRTMWGGIALAGVAIIALLPARSRLAVILGGIGLAVVAGAALVASPVGSLILDKVSERISATQTEDMSTIYRLAMFVHFLKGADHTPFFGWGVKPMWNHLVQFGYLTFNVENIHSLYFWLWLRTGPAGFVVALLSFGFILGRAVYLAIKAREPQHRALAATLMAMVLMYLFSGVFNPVYGEFRYVVPLGLGLAVLTRLAQFEKFALAAR